MASCESGRRFTHPVLSASPDLGAFRPRDSVVQQLKPLHQTFDVLAFGATKVVRLTRRALAILSNSH